MSREFCYLFFRNSFVNLGLYMFLNNYNNKLNMIFIIGISIVLSILELELNKETLVKKYSYKLRFSLFYTIGVFLEFILWNSFKIIKVKWLLGVLILTWIGLIIYVQIREMRFNKESKKYNKALEDYKNKLEENNKIAMENRFMRSVIYINGEPNENLSDKEEFCATTDAIYAVFIKKENIEIYNRSILTMKVKKLKESIPFSEIDSVTISVGNVFRTRGSALALTWHYEGEEERLYKFLFTLELKIHLRNGEVRKINTNEIRETFNYLINILKEKGIFYEDTNNLEKLLKEKSDNELLNYFLDNEIGTGGLGGEYFKNVYKK